MWVVAFSFSHIPSYRNVLNILMAIVRRTSPAPPRKQQQAVQQSRLLSLIHSDTPTLKLLLDDSMWTTCWTLSNIIPNRKRRTSPHTALLSSVIYSPSATTLLYAFWKYSILFVCFPLSLHMYIFWINDWSEGKCVCYIICTFLHYSAQGVSRFKSIKLMLKG